MQKDRMVALLIDISNPIGPWGDLDQRRRLEAEWKFIMELSDIATLLELHGELANGAYTDYLDGEDAMFHISEALVGIGIEYPRRVVNEIRREIFANNNRIPLIDVLGQLSPKYGVPLLVELFEETTLSENELISLASSLGDSKSDRARACLLEMREKNNASVALDEEISIALEIIDNQYKPT